MYIFTGKKFSFLSLAMRFLVSLSIQGAVPASTAHADILSAIAKCESGGQQFDPKTGKVLRNSSSPVHVGVFQIDESIHGKVAESLNMNIYTKEGNWAYARYLYGKYKTVPWLASKNCWGSVALKKVTKVKVATN